jgi:hypothetical protein
MPETGCRGISSETLISTPWACYIRYNRYTGGSNAGLFRLAVNRSWPSEFPPGTVREKATVVIPDGTTMADLIGSRYFLLAFGSGKSRS